jgi:FKBP-type peptidyl-prolyl cis-trans isomerase
MKKTFVFILLSITCVAHAQTKKPVPIKKKPPAKIDAAVIKTSLDSFSYALAVQVASFYKSQGIEQLNTTYIKRAFDDILGNKPLLLTTEICNMTVQSKMEEYMNRKALAESGKAQVVKEEGKKFLAENKKRPGVIELPNGLQYEILKEGTGEKPKATDTVKAHYAGSLINGQEFDNSYKRGEPLQIPVSGVIQGWVQALQMMPVGSKWKLYIPSDLGYGDRGAGGAIPGGATLIFEIELLEIVKR